MTIRRWAALLAALMLTISLTACGESGKTPAEETGTTTAATTAAPTEEEVRAQLLDALAAKCAALTSYEVTETVTASFEANGSVAAGSEVTANVTVTPDGVLAVCEQATGEDTAQTTTLYSAGERLYVKSGDARYTLELPLADVTKTCGVVLAEKMPDFSQSSLADQLTMTAIEGGYALSFELSGDAVKGELTTFANEWCSALRDTVENAEVAAVAVTAEVTPDGTPTRIGYTVLQNVLTNGNFFTLYTSVDMVFTAMGDDVTLTPPEDLTSYDGAETAYRAIVDAVQSGDVSAMYDQLTATYGQELVDSVLYVLGVSV